MSTTPSANIHWRSIPKGAKVVDTGKLFIVGEGKDAAVANWSSTDAVEAQRALKRLAIASMRGVCSYCEKDIPVLADGRMVTHTGKYDRPCPDSGHKPRAK